MPVQPQLFPDSDPQRSLPLAAPASVEDLRADLRADPKADSFKSAPLWLQRISLFVLVLFCVYLGVLVMILPWWTRMWDQNLFIESRPALARILHLGGVRGAISGLGLLDIWIGISEAVHYRESRS